MWVVWLSKKFDYVRTELFSSDNRDSTILWYKLEENFKYPTLYLYTFTYPFSFRKGSWIRHWLYIRTTLYVRAIILLRAYETTSVTTGVVATFVWPQPKGSSVERSPSEQVQISEKILSIYAHWRRLPASWNRIDGEAWSWDSRCLPRKRLIFIR